MLICLGGLEEVRLREKTSASGSFLSYEVLCIIYSFQAVDLGTLPSLNVWAECWFSIFFFIEYQLPLLPEQLCLVLGSKCLLELRMASLGKLIGFFSFFFLVLG